MGAQKGLSRVSLVESRSFSFVMMQPHAHACTCTKPSGMRGVVPGATLTGGGWVGEKDRKMDEQRARTE